MGKATRTNEKSAQPIRDPADIKRLRELLAENPRDRLLFEAAIQSGLPISRLLKLRVSDMADLAPGEELIVRDGRGRRIGVLVMNRLLHRIRQEYLDRVKPADEDYIFRSTKSRTPLKLSTVTNMVNEWFETLGLKGPRGIKSLRRTYEYHFAGPVSPDRERTGRQASLEGLKPIRMVSAHELAYQRLLEALVSGSIPPGERLIPEKIASRMNVSQMPVREALHRLREAGFVSTRGRGGMTATKLTVEDLEEIQYIRLKLEQDAVEKATPNCGEEVLARLERINLDSLASLRDRHLELAVKWNKEFHMTIYRQAGLPIMARIIEGLLDRIGPYIYIELQSADSRQGHLKKSLENHRRMLDGLRKGDASRVNHWLARDHNQTTIRIRRLIQERESDLRGG